jgi:hypothetical protein
MPGPLAAGLWMAVGSAGRRAAKKYGFMIARKKFPNLFKKAPKKDKTPDTKKSTPEKKPSTEKKKPTQTLSNEQVSRYLDLQRRRPNAFNKVPDWIKDAVRKRSAQVRDQKSIAYQRGKKPSSVPKKGRKVQGGNRKAPDSAADKKEQVSTPRSKPKPTTAKERTVKKRLPKIRKDTPELRKKMAEREKKRADIVEQMHDLSRDNSAITGGQYIPEEEKIYDQEMSHLRAKLKKLK